MSILTWTYNDPEKRSETCWQCKHPVIALNISKVTYRRRETYMKGQIIFTIRIPRKKVNSIASWQCYKYNMKNWRQKKSKKSKFKIKTLSSYFDFHYQCKFIFSCFIFRNEPTTLLILKEQYLAIPTFLEKQRKLFLFLRKCMRYFSLCIIVSTVIQVIQEGRLLVGRLLVCSPATAVYILLGQDT